MLLQSPQEVCERFRDIVRELQHDPFFPHTKIKKLHKPLEGYRYKMHPYRINYTINTKTQTIHIYDFFHRGRGYRS